MLGKGYLWLWVDVDRLHVENLRKKMVKLPLKLSNREEEGKN